jgi:hypothetical protein
LKPILEPILEPILDFKILLCFNGPLIDPTTDMVLTKGAGAGAKCDHQRIGVRARVRADLDLDVRRACVRRKKRSQLTPCKSSLF